MRLFAAVMIVIAVSACESIEVHGEGPGRALYSTIVGPVELTSPHLESALDQRLAALDARLRVIALEIATLPEANVNVSASLDPFFLKKEVFEAYLIELIEAMPPGMSAFELEAALRAALDQGIFGEMTIADSDRLIGAFINALCNAAPKFCTAAEEPFLSTQDIGSSLMSWQQSTIENNKGDAAWRLLEATLTTIIEKHGAPRSEISSKGFASLIINDLQSLLRYETELPWYYEILRWLKNNPIVLLLPISIGVAWYGFRLNASYARRRAALDIIEKWHAEPFYQTNVRVFHEYAPDLGLIPLSEPDQYGYTEDWQKLLGTMSKHCPGWIRLRIVWHLNHFEMIAIGIQRNIIDEDLYLKWLGSQVIQHWNRSAYLIQQMRFSTAKDGENYNKLFLSEFQWLVERWSDPKMLNMNCVNIDEKTPIKLPKEVIEGYAKTLKLENEEKSDPNDRKGN